MKGSMGMFPQGIWGNRNKMDTSGIYGITNLRSGDMYIGSSIHIFQRMKEHKRSLKANNHHNRYLQYSWNRYGEDVFIFKPIEFVKETLLNDREKFWSEHFSKRTDLYNFVIGRKNKIVDDETKRKISNKIKKLWEKGVYDLSEEEREERRKIFFENVKTPEAERKRRESLTGLRHTQETKEKISRKSRELWDDPESKFNSENYRKKLSSAMKDRRDAGEFTLTWEDVFAIRKLYKTGKFSQKRLGKRFNVPQQDIWLIVHNKGWHDPNYNPSYISSKEFRIKRYGRLGGGSPKLTKEQVLEIRRLREEEGYTYNELSQMFPVNTSSVSAIINRRTWRDI